MELLALKAAALASLKPSKQPQRFVSSHNSEEPLDELAALRAAALQSKIRKAASVSGSTSGRTSQNKSVSDGEDATSPLPAILSKFNRTDSPLQRSDDGSETSFLEAAEIDNNLSDNQEDNNATSVASSPPFIGNAIPDLLDGGVDITEFDDDDLMLEEELPLTQTNKPEPSSLSEKSKSKSQRAANGLSATRNRDRGIHQRLSPSRRRSRSPQLRRSRSPRLRETRSPSHQYRSPPLTPPHLLRSPVPATQPWHHGSPSKLTGMDKQYYPPKTKPTHSGDKNCPREDNSPTAKSKTDSTSTKKRVGKRPTVPDPLDDPTITEEERQTLLSRKRKFSASKVTATKKTIKLKKVKKKSSITKRLGTKKQKVVRVTSRSPDDIVETVALDQEKVLSKQSTPSPSPLTRPPPLKVAVKSTKRKAIKDRLGGYASTTELQVPVKRKRRQVSVETPTSDTDNPNTVTDNRKVLPKIKALTKKPLSPPVDERELSLSLEIKDKGKTISTHKHNIWSTRLESTSECEPRMENRVGRRMERARNDLRSERERSEDSNHSGSLNLPLRSARSNSNTAQPVWSAGMRDELSSKDHNNRNPAPDGKIRKERELDERIRKIQEKNAKLLERQKEIEREKLLYG